MEFVTLVTLVTFWPQGNPFVGKAFVPSRPITPSPMVTDATRKAATLGPNQPTNLVRATLLARAYFDRNFGRCGCVDPVREGKAHWAFPTRGGYAGTTGPEIRIDKLTGTTTAEGHPAVVNPSTTYGDDPKARAIREQSYERRVTSPDAALRAAAGIGPRQEIGEYEAWLMTRAYFWTQLGGCGGAAMPRLDGPFWIAHTVCGAAGRRGPDIKIERCTEETWANGHPHVADPQNYRQAIRTLGTRPKAKRDS